MLILDTDHLVEYQRGTSAEAQRLKQRLDEAGELFGTTIITVEEVMRGWMAAIRRTHDPFRQINAYRSYNCYSASSRRETLALGRPTPLQRLSRKKAKVRISTMDLKIAAIALTRRHFAGSES